MYQAPAVGFSMVTASLWAGTNATGLLRLTFAPRAATQAFERVLGEFRPDVVHVMAKGRVVKSGGKELALELEEKGYGWIGSETVGARS